MASPDSCDQIAQWYKVRGHECESACLHKRPGIIDLALMIKRLPILVIGYIRGERYLVKMMDAKNYTVTISICKMKS